jgi:hypothetical protein
MNKKIILPFSEINLINCQNRQFKFLSGYFFHADFNTDLFFKINLNFKKVEKPKKYKQAEKDTFTTEKYLYLSDTKKKLCQIASFIGDEVNVNCDLDFDLYYLFSFILEPLLIVNLANKEVVFIHSSAVTKNKNATLFAAWRNTGKTETILKLSTKNNYAYMSDDYVVLHRNKAYSFPKKINLFSYNLNKELMRALPKTNVIKLKTFMYIKKTLERLSYIMPNKTIAKVFFRVSELAEVATNFKISPSQLGMNFDSNALIEKINIIQKSSYKFNNIIPSKDASDLLTTVIDYELNDFFKIIERQSFIQNNRQLSRRQFLDNYNKVLNKILSKKEINLKSVN